MFIGFTPSKTIESLQVEELQRNGKKKKNSYTYTQRKHVATKQDASYIVVSSCRGTET